MSLSRTSCLEIQGPAEAALPSAGVGCSRWLSVLLAALLMGVGCGTDEPLNRDTDAGGQTADDDDAVETDDDDVVETDDDDEVPAPVTPQPVDPEPTPTPAAPNFNSDFGRTCEDDDDCPGALTCITPDATDFLGGGVANGYCTLDCADDNALCAGESDGAVCVEMADSAFCVQGCAIGQQLSKCQGREDLVCDSIALPGAPFCRPMCLNDADCGEDLFCDVGNGVCLAERPPGKSVGEECTPVVDPTDEDECAGFCLSFSDDFAACAGICNIGAIGCGGSAESEVPGEPICEFPFEQTAGLGDLARCIQGCECADDCSHSDAECVALSDEADRELARDFYGAAGFCGTAEIFADSDRLVECPDRPDPPAPADAGPDAAVIGADAAPTPAADARAPGVDAQTTVPADAASTDAAE